MKDNKEIVPEEIIIYHLLKYQELIKSINKI